MSAQTATVAAVAQRGYLEDWNDGELLARQVAKLAKELGELAECVDVDNPMLAHMLSDISMLGGKAREVFDMPHTFVGAEIVNTQAAISELTDMQVVIAVAAHALGVPDVMGSACVKAQADAARGVRNGERS